MKAILRIVIGETSSLTEVVLSGALQQPCPTHPVLREEWLGFSYHDQVVVVANEAKGGIGTTIHTRFGSGRGQAATFDKLMGARVAAARKQLAKQLREELKSEGSVNIELTTTEVAEIEERIQTHSDDLPEDKFLWQASSWHNGTVLVTDSSFSEARAAYLAA